MVLLFRDYCSFDEVCNLLVKFSEDLNAKADTTTSYENCLTSQTTLSTGREYKRCEGAATRDGDYFLTDSSGDRLVS